MKVPFHNFREKCVSIRSSLELSIVIFMFVPALYKIIPNFGFDFFWRNFFFWCKWIRTVFKMTFYFVYLFVIVRNRWFSIYFNKVIKDFFVAILWLVLLSLCRLSSPETNNLTLNFPSSILSIYKITQRKPQWTFPKNGQSGKCTRASLNNPISNQFNSDTSPDKLAGTNNCTSARLME